MKNLLYVTIILAFFIFSCEEENSNACSEIISNAEEALSLWSSVLDYNMTNDEYPEDAEETCNAYYDALILLKESNCTTDLEYLSSEDIEDLRLNQCDIQ